MIDCFIYIHIYSFWLVEEGFSRTFWRRLEAGDICLGPVHSSVAPPTTLTLNKRFLKLQQDTFFGNKDHSWDLQEIKGREKHLREGKMVSIPQNHRKRKGGKLQENRPRRTRLFPGVQGWKSGARETALRIVPAGSGRSSG